MQDHGIREPALDRGKPIHEIVDDARQEECAVLSGLAQRRAASDA